jgi:hypothetical protein
MKPMDPGRLEASLAMADAPADQEGRKEVLRGYTDDDYHLEASYAADAWNVLAVAEHEIILASRRYGHMDGTYRDGGEI